ncbi:MAG: phenylalanine--tRNA ligase subunit alpha, partial [Anaerolineae bacterium]|nr:phenylalanine--tRNA ligase subunit alpha [Anaerolineae bacterium]
MLKKLDQIEEQVLGQLDSISSSDSLSKLEGQTIGKKGEITTILRSIGTLPAEERKAVGEKANQVKQKLEAAIAQREEAIRAQEMIATMQSGAIDVTLPGRPNRAGRIHPANQALREIYAIWAEMGFQVYRSPDVETDDNNFSLLNIPPYHPARDMWDTFHTTQPDVVLRTHTSPGQIRVMKEYAPDPIRVILPGMCYRYEQVTVRSEFQFNQVEGLAVGYNIRMTDLKGTMAAFARRFYGADRQVRFRSSHFPFTEPSIEV